jgi:ubiquinone/menaquinone biosynthesis C-methylase UbiE
MPLRYAKTRDIEQKYDADILYDARYKEIQFEKFDLLLANAERELKAKDASIHEYFRGTVVDIGCGSGLLVSFFSARSLLGGMRYVGIDISEGMLGVARSKLRHPAGGNFIQATADLLPLRDDVSRIAFSISTYQNLDAAQQSSFIDEIMRILSKDWACFLFSFLDKPPLSDQIEAITEMLASKFSYVKLIEQDARIEDRLLVCFDAMDS